MLSSEQIERWADLLVKYGLRVAPGESVLLTSQWEARPLVEACYRAIVLEGGYPLVRLEFPGLTEFFLEHAMLDLDPGARFLGELGIGLNPGIQRFTRSILYDEKIGGTIHLALGQSYPETGGVNKSALHWDLIVDTRRNGRITADGTVVMENGVWSVGSIDTVST